MGKHVYFQVDGLPASVKAMGTPIGNFELCGQGRQVVAPPSVHPDTDQPYQVEKALDLLHLTDLKELAAWIENFKPGQLATEWRAPASINHAAGDATLNPKVIDAIPQLLVGQGFKQRGDWLRSMCDPGRDTELDDRLKGVASTGECTSRLSSWQPYLPHWTG